MSAGAIFAVTVITPLAPTAIIGIVSGSSPDSTVNRSPQAWMISETCCKDPLPSLIATMLRIAASRPTVDGSMFTLVRLGMLYRTNGRSTASAIAL